MLVGDVEPETMDDVGTPLNAAPRELFQTVGLKQLTCKKKTTQHTKVPDDNRDQLAVRTHRVRVDSLSMTSLP